MNSNVAPLIVDFKSRLQIFEIRTTPLDGKRHEYGRKPLKVLGIAHTIAFSPTSEFLREQNRHGKVTEERSNRRRRRQRLQ